MNNFKVNEWMNNWVNNFKVNKWMNEWMNEWIILKKMNECLPGEESSPLDPQHAALDPSLVVSVLHQPEQTNCFKKNWSH